MRIRLNKLILVGDKKNYKVEFKDGLNFITGPISTGKSTILELIDYCLGKKQHKNYDEVRKTCNSVALDLTLNDKRYLIERPLFSFEIPVKIYSWNTEINKFNKEFIFRNIINPKEENSLAEFLQQELKIPKTQIANQIFSFRDIYKYCYISQPIIDTEDLLKEKTPAVSFKRKPTLEIILNSLNELLNGLKNEKKLVRESIHKLMDRKEAIVTFLRNVELFSSQTENDNKKNYLIEQLSKHYKELDELKEKGKIKNDNTKSFEHQLFNLKKDSTQINEEITEINKYLSKLNLLQNQYKNEIIKLDYLILSNGKLNSIEYTSCPSCNIYLEEIEIDNCNLCGKSLIEFDNEEENAIKLEKKRLKSRLTSLITHIASQKNLLHEKIKSKEKNTFNTSKIKEKINSIQNKYISPYIEKIEFFNRQIGELNKKIDTIDSSVNVQKELVILSDNIQVKENRLNEIIEEIDSIENETSNFPELLNRLSEIFNEILHEFNFPKLNNAYINQKNYLPYVRNTKYNQIGSLGAVTLINIAYFLSILKLSLEREISYHPKLLLLDTVGKNLGTRENADNEDEFKDSKIFKSLLKYLVDFSEKNKGKMQLFVINNDYTKDIGMENIIVQFDGIGTKGIKYGLIDDMV